MASNAPACLPHAQQAIDGAALEQDHRHRAAQNRPRIFGNGPQIKATAHPDQEHAEQQAFEWLDRRFDLATIIAGGQHQSGGERTHGR